MSRTSMVPETNVGDASARATVATVRSSMVPETNAPVAAVGGAGTGVAVAAAAPGRAARNSGSPGLGAIPEAGGNSNSDADADAESATLLGAGGFGAVFTPALPNENATTGALTRYPGNVTKMFYREKNHKAILTKIKELPRLMGYNAGHRVDPYRKTYMFRNLPPAVREAIKAADRRHGRKTAKNTDPLFLVRMPDLGLDLTQILPTYASTLREMPFGLLLSQIRKLFLQVERLASNNVAHFDVRGPNIMMNPTTGVMTIVDFDILEHINTLWERHSFNGFYSYPPEALFFKDLDELPASVSDKDLAMWLVSPSAPAAPAGAAADSTHASRMERYVRHCLHYTPQQFQFYGIKPIPIKANEMVIDYNMMNFRYLKAAPTREEL